MIYLYSPVVQETILPNARRDDSHYINKIDFKVWGFINAWGNSPALNANELEYARKTLERNESARPPPPFLTRARVGFRARLCECDFNIARRDIHINVFLFWFYASVTRLS